jgi:hypothetical protein
VVLTNGNYDDFTKVNPFCSKPTPPVQAAGARLTIDRTPLLVRGPRPVIAKDLRR